MKNLYIIFVFLSCDNKLIISIIKLTIRLNYSLITLSIHSRDNNKLILRKVRINIIEE